MHSCRKSSRWPRHDDGITLPTLGTAGLAETGRLLEASVDNLTDLAERAVATGDVEGAKVAAKAALARDPGNIKAKTVELVIEKKRTQAQQVVQATAPPAAAVPAAAAVLRSASCRSASCCAAASRADWRSEACPSGACTSCATPASTSRRCRPSGRPIAAASRWFAHRSLRPVGPIA